MAKKYNLGNVGGISKTNLLNSEISSTGIYDLNDSVKNYSFILVTVRSYVESNSNNTTMLIDTDDITTTAEQNDWITIVALNRYIGFNFTNGYEKITVNDVGNAADSSVAITKIIGIN